MEAGFIKSVKLNIFFFEIYPKFQGMEGGKLELYRGLKEEGRKILR